MNKTFPKVFSVITILALMLTAMPMRSAQAVSATLVINEIDYDQPGTDTAEFIELKNVSAGTINLDNYVLELVNGTGGGAVLYATIDLPNVNLAAGDYYVICANAATVANCDLDSSPDIDFIQNGAPDGSGIRLSGVLQDAVSYEGNTGSPYTEGSGSGLEDNPATADMGISRCADGIDTDVNNVDLTFKTITPGATNACIVFAEPKINEFSASTVSTDVEYVEIFGTANTNYSTYKVLDIEGEGSGAGTIDSVISISSTGANGLYLASLAANEIENDTVTLLLVSDFSGSAGQDLDTNNDGVLDLTPWTSIVDSVAIRSTAPTAFTYAVPILGPNYDGISSFTPGGASRIPDGFDTDSGTNWVRNDFDLAGIPPNTGTPVFGEAYNTPGALNSVVVPKLVINEIDYDQPSTDTAEYVEIRNNESVAVSLSGATLEFVNASTSAIYDTITLPNVSLAAGDYFVVCANAATVVNCDLDDGPNTDFIQNGAPDAVGLRFNGVLIDAVSYEGDTAAPYTESSGTGLVDTASGAQSISRCPDGSDTNVNNVDFTLTGITPGAANDCASLTPQLSITDVSLSEGNGGTTSFNFAVNLSVPALAGGVTFNIATADGTAQDDVPPTEDNDYVAKTLTGQSIPAGGTTYAFSVMVNGDITPEIDETFFVNVTGVTGATVIDGQGLGTIVNDDGLAITFIHNIQGSGSAITGTGPFSVEAIVVGDYQTQGSNQLRGFFLQEEDADANAEANPATSEGIFVFCLTCPTVVSVGDKVRVTGSASEFFDMSQISATTAASVTVLSSGNPLPSPAGITLPITGVPTGDLAVATAFINAYYEKFEGMLVTFTNTLSVSEYFELARYGQVTLSQGGRPRQFTDANLPSAAGYIDHQINLATRRVILDDTDNRENRPVDTPNTAYYHPVPGLSTGNFFRGGDTITNLTGVLHWSFAGGPSPNVWRIRPVTEAYNYTFTPVNTRPAVPSVAGSLKVASFNVLNYFLTIDTSNTCAPTQNQDCRGADSALELERQRTKMLAALSAIDADVFGFMEMENTPNVEPLADIVAGLPGYDYIDTGVIGGDAIRVGIIYKSATVQPVGGYAILDSSVDPDFIDTRNRPALAQTFEEIATGARFTVVVNHLKSKGSGCGTLDDDTTKGQGNCNGTRTLAAQALADWLATDPTGSGDSDVLIIGDLNSYAREDPIVALQTAGYTDLVAAFGGPNAYGYVFDGQLGYLDHALANASLNPQVAGVAEWHINADEIPLFDYNDDARTADEAAFEEESDVLLLYEPNEFRTSDHDPVIIGLNLNAPPTVDAGGPYSVDEGGSVLLTATGDDPNGDTLTYAWDLDNNGSFETSGQSVSFSAALLDGPDGPYTVKVRATDPLGLFADDTATVSVDNVAPTVDVFFGSNSVSCGPSNAALTVNFTDPGVADTHSAVIDWGDGNTQNVASITSGSAFTHTYAAAGLYTATVTVTDDDGGVDSDTADVMVQFNTSGFLQPVNTDGSSVFKYNSTIPVKISFTDCDGSTPADLAPTIKVTVLSGASIGLEINEPISTSAADTTGVMRFSTNQYIYNLATKPLPDPSATYLITVTIPYNGQTFTVQFSLKP